MTHDRDSAAGRICRRGKYYEVLICSIGLSELMQCESSQDEFEMNVEFMRPTRNLEQSNDLVDKILPIKIPTNWDRLFCLVPEGARIFAWMDILPWIRVRPWSVLKS